MIFRRKKAKRPIFGFPCTPSISNGIRVVASILKVPYYCVGEHIVQVGTAVVMAQLEDTDAIKQLEEHLVESHLLVKTVDTDNEYDESAMAEARKKQLEHQGRERVIRSLVNEVENNGMPPQLVALAAKLLVETSLNRKRTQ